MITPESVLYYPNIEIANDGWLKSALLLWDTVYRIVPSAYTPNDMYPSKVAIDAGRLRAVSLESTDLASVALEFRRFLDRLPFLPAGLDGARTDRLHRDKIDSRLYPALEQLGAKVDPNGFLDLPSDLTRGYMMYLAKAVAGRRNLAMATDSRHAWTITPYYRDKANFGDYVYDRDAKAFYCCLIFDDIVPANLLNVDMKDVMDFVDKRGPERQTLRKTITDFSEELAACSSPGHVHDLCNTYAKGIKAAKDDFRKSSGFLNPDDKHALLTLGVPVSATVLSALAVGVDPFDLMKIAGAVLIGAVAAYADYKKVRFSKRRESDVSYLVDIDKELVERSAVPRYNRIFEEFIND